MFFVSSIGVYPVILAAVSVCTELNFLFDTVFSVARTFSVPCSRYFTVYPTSSFSVQLAYKFTIPLFSEVKLETSSSSSYEAPVPSALAVHFTNEYPVLSNEFLASFVLLPSMSYTTCWSFVAGFAPSKFALNLTVYLSFA